MEFDILTTTTMNINHRNQQIKNISLAEFKSQIKVNGNGDIISPFKEINQFLKTQVSMSDQDKIFSIYKEIIDELVDIIFDIDMVVEYVSNKISVVYDIIKVDDIQKWMEENNLFQIPAGVSEKFTGEYDKDRTYNKAKYKGLIALSTAAKMIVPIWGEFTPIQKTAIGTTQLPIPMLNMLRKSSIIDSQQYKDYETYAEATIAAGQHSPEHIVALMGTDMNVIVNIANNFVKKIAMATNTQNAQAITNLIFNLIANAGSYSDSPNNMGIVRTKHHSKGDEETGMVERFDKRESLTQGDISMLEYYLSRYENICKLWDVVNEEDYVKMDALAKHLEKEKFKISQSSLKITQQICYSAPLKYIGDLDKYRGIAASFYILFKSGYHQLALLTVSNSSVSRHGLIVNHKSKRRDLPESLIKELDNIYQVNIIEKNKPQINLAVNAINMLYISVSSGAFKCVVPDDVKEQLIKDGYLNKYGLFVVNENLPIDFGNLIVDTYYRNLKNV